MDNFLIILFSLFSSVFFLLTVLILRVANRRQKQKIMPDILLIPGKVYLFWNFRQGFLFPDIWMDNPRGRMEEDNWILRCLNIGHGTAKNICLFWDYDIVELSRLIMENDRNKFLKIKHSMNYLCIDIMFPREKYPELPEHCSIGINDHEEPEITYLLPAGINKTHQRMPVPKSYLTLVSLLYFIRHLNKDSGNIEGKVPLCRLVLEYDDIENRAYRSSYSVGFRNIKYSQEEPGPNVLFCRAEIFINQV